MSNDAQGHDKGSYDIGTMPGGVDRELTRLRDQALMMWDKEARNLQWLGLRDGMSVLELGAGPGFITEQLLEMLPNSTVTFVERDPLMVTQATSYLGDKYGGRLRMVEASVMDLGLDSDSYDFAYGRYLFQHLPDPVGAAKEVIRVLKPDGKLVICDIDDRAHIFTPEPEGEAKVILERLRADHAALGGNRMVGRELFRIMKAAGFGQFDIEAIATHSDIVGLAALGQVENSDEWKLLVEAGMITEAELPVLIAFDKVFFSSEPLVQLIVFFASGTKPAAHS